MVAYTKPQQWKIEGDMKTGEREIRPRLLILDLKEDKLFIR